VQVFSDLADHYSRVDRPDRGIAVANSMLALDPSLEWAHRALMRLYLRTGRREAALRQYQECTRILSEELGVAPAEETRRLTLPDDPIPSADAIVSIGHVLSYLPDEEALDRALVAAAEALKPGVKESQIVALAASRLYEMGSDLVEGINAISGERCSPHPHNFTDRLIRPGDQAFFDVIQSFIGYRTCYYRTFAVGRATSAQRTAYRKAREWMDRTIELLRPGMSSDEVAHALPTADEIGFASEIDAFGLNFCHGLGLGLHERPLISRVTSFREPLELKVGMVFAVETYCPATDGISAARIEEEVVLTPDGAKIITLFPAEELPIANPY